MKRSELTSAIIMNMVLLHDQTEGRKPTVEEYSAVLSEELNPYLDGIENNIKELIKDWEEKMSEDDRTLYSLGLRRALDIVRGESSI